MLIGYNAIVKGKKMVYQPIQNMLSRHLAVIKDGEVHIDEDQINLFEYFDQSLIPLWKPYKVALPYEATTQINADIETEGLNPEIHAIKMIGVINERGEHHIIDWLQDERNQLLTFFSILDRKQPFWINTFNGFLFDWWFIKRRCELLGIKYPLWVAPNKTVNSTAQIFGKPVEYYAHWFNGGKSHLIDLYHQALRWDFVARKLTSYRLKTVPVQLGLRSADDRVELTYPEMLEIYKSGDLTRMEQYLIDDLKDTKLLADFFNPAIYYELEYMPDWKVQTLSSSGNGTKWNDILLKAYKPLGYVPSVSRKLKFKGALTSATAGFFDCVSKYDVSGMYPSIMLSYGITSSKDFNYELLARLKYGVEFRADLKIKKENKTISKTEKQQEGTAKVMNNSAYGVLGVTGKEFNDSVSAALVTGYGRAIFKLLRKLAIEFGGKPIQMDCVTAETLVMTDKGVFPIVELAGKRVNIINGNREWVNVLFEEFGEDQIYDIKFSYRSGGGYKIKEKVIRCNSRHKWYLDRYKKFIKTEDLHYFIGSKINVNYASRPEKNGEYFNGVCHGMIYGDFQKKSDCNSSYVAEVDENKLCLIQSFIDANNYNFVSCNPTAKGYYSIRVSCKDKNFDCKQLPVFEDISLNYLYGFICGMLATDGSVNDDGFNICGQKPVIDFIEKYSQLIGMNPTRVNKNTDVGRKTVIRGKICETKKQLYRLFFAKDSCLLEDLIRPFHISRFNKSKFPSYWQIESVILTDSIEKVYCCKERQTHIFTLDGSLKSGNTDGIFIAHQKGQSDDLFQYIQDRLPKGIKITPEIKERAIFIPPKDSKVHDFESDEVETGLRKNYLVFDINTGELILVKGKYRKRDRCTLEKTFQIDLIKIYLTQGKQAAENFYKKYYEKIESGFLDKSLITITRKARKNEKEVFQRDLVNDEGVCSYYMADGFERLKTKIKTIVVKSNTGPYSKKFYLDLITTQFNEFWQFVK